jgi:hypothetical protein
MVLKRDADGAYDEAAIVTGDQSWTDPVLGVEMVPARLVARGTHPGW